MIIHIEESLFKKEDITDEDIVDTRETQSVFCNICSKRFDDSNLLAIHMNIHLNTKEAEVKKGEGTAEKPHAETRKDQYLSCDICSKRFDDSSMLAIHMNIHLNTKEAAVTQGECTVGNPVTDIKETKSVTCNVCSKRFAESSLLSIHKWIHVGQGRSLEGESAVKQERTEEEITVKEEVEDEFHLETKVDLSYEQMA